MRFAMTSPRVFFSTSANEDDKDAESCRTVSSVPPPPPSGVVAKSLEHHDLLGVSVVGLRIERVIAEGGIGVVYAARAPEADAKRRSTAPNASVHNNSACTYAIKVLQKRHAGDAGIASRFEREIT